MRLPWHLALLSPIRFYVRNTGNVPLLDPEIRFRVAKTRDLLVTDGLPEAPGLVSAATLGLPSPEVWVEPAGTDWAVRARLGKIQPGAYSATESIYVGCSEAHGFKFVAELYDDNLREPIKTELSVEIVTKMGWLPENDDDGAEDEDEDEHRRPR